MCPPGKKTVETANANYEKAKPNPPPIKQHGSGNHSKAIHLPLEPNMLKL